MKKDTQRPYFNPSFSMDDLRANLHLDKTKNALEYTALLEGVKKILDDYDSVYTSFDLKNTFPEKFGGALIWYVLNNTNLLKDAKLLKTAFEQCKIDSQYITVFNNAFVVALAKPDVVKENRIITIVSAYPPDIKQFSEEFDEYDIYTRMGVVNGKEKEVVEIIASNDFSFTKEKLSFNLGSVMAMGYVLGLATAFITEGIAKYRETEFNPNVNFDYLTCEVFTVDFDRPRTLLNNFNQAVFDTQPADIDFVNGLETGNASFYLESILESIENLCRYIGDVDNVFFGNSFGRTREIFQTAVDSVTKTIIENSKELKGVTTPETILERAKALEAQSRDKNFEQNKKLFSALDRSFLISVQLEKIKNTTQEQTAPAVFTVSFLRDSAMKEHMEKYKEYTTAQIARAADEAYESFKTRNVAKEHLDKPTDKQSIKKAD